jgi:5-methylthioribose kinase
MPFRALTAATLPAYLATLPPIRERFTDLEALDVVEVGDGNVNFVFLVTQRGAPERTVCVKQAVPYLRCVGESWPLTRHRMDVEVRALHEFGAVCPQHVPAVYFADSEMSLVVMQRLCSHRILRLGLIDGLVYPRMADHLSPYLARTLFFTSDLYLAPDVKKAAVAAASNPELCKITEDLVFTHPYDDGPSNAYPPGLPRRAIDRLQRHPPLRAAVGEMKYAFMTAAEARLHGDLHTGSVMANAEETFVIDPEFSFYGPMGFDVGAFIANLFLAYLAQEHRQREAGRDPAPYREWLLESAAQIWEGFEREFLALWREHEADGASFIGRDLDGASAEAFRAAFMRHVFADTLGFAACKMMRRIVGLAKVADIAGITDAAARTLAEVRALRIAEHLILDRRALGSIRAVVDAVARLGATPLEE